MYHSLKAKLAVAVCPRPLWRCCLEVNTFHQKSPRREPKKKSNERRVIKNKNNTLRTLRIQIDLDIGYIMDLDSDTGYSNRCKYWINRVYIYTYEYPTFNDIYIILYLYSHIFRYIKYKYTYKYPNYTISIIRYWISK